MYFIKFTLLLFIFLIIASFKPVKLLSQDQLISKDVSFDLDLGGYNYPFKTFTYEFQSQSYKLDMIYMYLEAKNATKGTITLLHGKNFNGAYWERLANKLNSLGYNVLIPDQIGFGKSSKPINYQYTFETLALNTKKLLKNLNIKSTQLIGHSMGGMLASRFALLFPDLVQNLILINPIGLENYLKYVEYKDIDFFYKKELNLKPIDIINYQKKYYYDGLWNNEYEKLASHLIGWVNGNDWPYLAKISAKTYDMIFTGSVIEEFKDFKMPVSIIIGTRDRTGPGRNWKKNNIDYELGRYDKFGKNIKKLNNEILIVELDRLGHLPQIENFDIFYKALEKKIISND
ncbi:MAG: alpha/beta hydrolase [Rickettsiales bacterium]|nr:alpha/beta hydrolase [Rickettsiales bacterium]OUV79158.1 MAG: alpha/beta hydrolase [Rickettsiales bacterium TMED131]